MYDEIRGKFQALVQTASYSLLDELDRAKEKDAGNILIEELGRALGSVLHEVVPKEIHGEILNHVKETALITIDNVSGERNDFEVNIHLVD